MTTRKSGSQTAAPAVELSAIPAEELAALRQNLDATQQQLMQYASSNTVLERKLAILSRKMQDQANDLLDKEVSIGLLHEQLQQAKAQLNPEPVE